MGITFEVPSFARHKITESKYIWGHVALSGHIPLRGLTATTASEKNKAKCTTFTHLLRSSPWGEFSLDVHVNTVNLTYSTHGAYIEYDILNFSMHNSTIFAENVIQSE